MNVMRIQLQTVLRSLGPDLASQTQKLNTLMEDFYRRMSDDLIIGFFFEGRDLKHIAEMQAKFLLNAAGFSERFEGKGPATAHVALPPILAGHFDRRLIVLRETLIANGVLPHMADLWISFEDSFRAIVVSEEIQHKKPH